MNQRRTIATWLNIIMALLVLAIALVNGLSTVASNHELAPGPWKVSWIVVNIEMWVNLFWGVAILIKRVPNWFLFILGLMGTSLFGYLNIYVQYFFWFQDLILSLACLFFAYGTYRNYKVRTSNA